VPTGLLAKYRWLSDALVVAALVVFSVGVTIWWMHPQVNSFTIQPFGDQAWIQASAQVGIQTGPFATNLHTGWFSGFDPWAYPTGGAIGFFGMAWVLGHVTASSSNVLVGIMSITAAVISVCTYYAIRLAAGRPVRRWVAFVGGAAIGVSPYVESKMGHYLVAAFYLLPLLIAVTGFLRTPRTRRAIVIALALVAAAALLSTLWWSLVSLYLLAVGLLVALLMRQWPWVRRIGLVLLATGLGSLLPLGLSATHKVADGTWNRQLWDSTVFSGSLSDFLLASPLVRALWPHLDTMLPATSKELSTVGLLPGLAAIAAVVIALTAYLSYGPDDRRRIGWLFVLLQITLLTFLTLGLGTVQEALLQLVGVDSPLRGWSRLSILVALIGVVLVAPWISDRFNSTRSPVRLVAIVVSVVVSLGLIVADVNALVMMPPRGLPTIEEKAAVDYLAATAGDCPVAQLPVGTFPDFPMADGTPTALTYYYRGFIPYLLRPSGTWSFGAAYGTASDKLMRALPPTLTATDLQALRKAGYCAVLYDNHYAEWMRAKNLKWPGEATKGLTPDWSDQRFDVYLLNRT
jgi:hypothetical protein